VKEKEGVIMQYSNIFEVTIFEIYLPWSKIADINLQNCSVRVL
jgi:hypothetical protein